MIGNLDVGSINSLARIKSSSFLSSIRACIMVNRILIKNNGGLPKVMSNQKMNRIIREVLALAGLPSPVEMASSDLRDRAPHQPPIQRACDPIHCSSHVCHQLVGLSPPFPRLETKSRRLGRTQSHLRSNPYRSIACNQRHRGARADL